MSKRKKNTFFRDWAGDIKVEWQMVGFVLALILLFVVCGTLIEAFNYFWQSARCDQFAAMNPQFDFHFTYMNGCLVRTQESNTWISATKILELIN